MGLVELGQFIERERGRIGVTQLAFGNLIGRNQDWVSKIERGILKEEPGPETLHRLADVTRTPIEVVLEISGYLPSKREPVVFTSREELRKQLDQISDLPPNARRAIDDVISLVDDLERNG